MKKGLQRKVQNVKSAKKPRQRAGERLSFCWADELTGAAAAPGLQKGERTKLRLKAGTAALLAEMSYQALRVADIAAKAGVSHGLFYHYFQDKRQIVLEVLDEYLNEATARYLVIHTDADSYEAIYLSNLFYLNLYQKNAGLMASVLSLSEQDPEFCKRYNDLVHKWHLRMSRAIGSVGGLGGDKDKTRLIFGYSLGGMIDQVCRQRFVQQSPQLMRIAPENERLAEVLSVIWYRAAFGEDPIVG